MATVYLADDLTHNRKVALKVLKPELAVVVGVSLATVKNDLSFGRAWLARELGPHSGAAGTVS